MTDIVERLRSKFNAWNSPLSEGLPDGAVVLLDAADEIERLRGAHQPEGKAEAVGEYELAETVHGEIVRIVKRHNPLKEAIQPSGQTLPKPGRNDGGEPCGECHLQPGETCDICGAAQPSGQTRAGIERLRGRGVFGDDGVPRLLLPQLRAEIIEECAKVAEAWDGKPCGPASGWTDDQRDYYDAGQLDASSSIVRAIRALAAQGEK